MNDAYINELKVLSLKLLGEKNVLTEDEVEKCISVVGVEEMHERTQEELHIKDECDVVLDDILAFETNYNHINKKERVRFIKRLIMERNKDE